MKSKMPEWYRIVTPKPDDETIEKRKLAVTDFLEHLSSAEDYQLLIACVTGVIDGFESGFNNDSPLVKTIYSCISSHQPVFIGDLSENALEYRVCCAITIGEILTRDGAEGNVPKEDAQIAGSLLISAFGIQSITAQRFLQLALQELKELAYSTIEMAATARRRRPNLNLQTLKGLTVPGDIESFWKELLPKLNLCFTNLQQQARADREELEVLWWLYNGFSETVDRPLRDLDTSVAALCCGSEVANRVIIPPSNSIRQMVLQAISKERKKTELSAKPLEQMVSQWDEKIWDLLGPTDPGLNQITQEFPVLLPLSWLCSRLRDSQGSSGWDQEFLLKTGLDPKQSYQPAVIALQVFNERAAQRIYLGE